MKYDISEIEKLYPNWYNKNSPLFYDDQKWIWENIPLPEEDETKLKELATSDTVLIGSVTGSYKSEENLTENQRKLLAIANLRKSKAGKTPIKDIAAWLEEVFGHWKVMPLHWMYLAESYTPKAINSVIDEMQKRKKRGGMPINKPGAYFTKILTRYHPRRKTPKRKTFRDTNGTHKQHNL